MLENPQLLQWVKESALELITNKRWIVKKIKIYAVMYGANEDPYFGYIAQVKFEEFDSYEEQYINVSSEDLNYQFFAEMQKGDIVEFVFHDSTKVEDSFTPHMSQFIFPVVTLQNPSAKRK